MFKVIIAAALSATSATGFSQSGQSNANLIQGYGLVVGLKGSGDSRFLPLTRKLILVYRKCGLLSSGRLEATNVAVVAVSSEMPYDARPGEHCEAAVRRLADAKSLRDGFLLPTNLYSFKVKGYDAEFAVASGPLNCGPFQIGASELTGNAKLVQMATVVHDSRRPWSGGSRSADPVGGWTNSLAIFQALFKESKQLDSAKVGK